jgi:outer membrane protein assembly factor BamB
VLFAPDRELLELDAASGVTLRTKPIGEPMVGAPAPVAGRWIYFASAGHLVALRREGLQEAWSYGDELRIAFVQARGESVLVADWSGAKDAQMRRFDAADEWRP